MKSFNEWWKENETLHDSHDPNYTWLMAKSSWMACAREYDKILDKYKELLNITHKMVDQIQELHPEIKEALKK